MSDTLSFFSHLASRILAGYEPQREDYLRLARLPDPEVLHLLPGADLLRGAFCGRRIHLCTILNAKSGKCSEDCRFCAQSRLARNSAPVYPLKSRAEMRRVAEEVGKTPVHRFSLVTSGKGVSPSEVEEICGAVSGVEHGHLSCCTSLGILDQKELMKLKAAGVTRYHHNLETSRGHFPAVCTSHGWDERVATVRGAKAAGLSVCCGGIFGVGEDEEQRVELALELKNLAVDAVPINFFTPIPGTPLAAANFLTPWSCLKIIALFRFVLPDREIIVCGGRQHNLRSLHPLVFSAGASGIMTGNYLVTAGRGLQEDLGMLRDLQFELR